MTSQATEKALQELLDKRAIEELRYRYWYAILDKDVDRLVSLFTDDVRLEYGFGIELTGRDEARGFFTRLLGSADLLRQVPRGANGLVELTGEDTAKGRWMVEAITLSKGRTTGSLSSVQYFEEYSKVDGAWKLAKIRNDYLYFENVELQER